MAEDNIQKYLSEISPNSDDFYPKIFRKVAENRKQTPEADNLKRVLLEEYTVLSERIDQSGLQDSASARNLLKTRRLANLLISEEGKLNASLLPKVIRLLKENLYSLGPDRQYDAKRNEHLLRVLTMLHEDKKLQRKISSIGKPYSHKFADQIIRDTLQLAPHTVVTDAHARRAVLSAWMALLRQSVGSCFATAPATIVHEEQPDLFLQDLKELLGTGRLKRTFGGTEYAVPLSYSWGAGDLRRMLLFTTDSFDEELGMWLSPGFETALMEVGILDKEGQYKKIKSLIQNVLSKDLARNQQILITAEEILRRILLVHLGLTEEDLTNYEQRPRGMIHGGLLMTSSGSDHASGGKGKLCADFYTQIENAQNAFKAFGDNALLKSWEFTVASFAETKAQFTKWNLYSSLGLGHDEAGGIGPGLYTIINQKLQECNQKVHELQAEYEQAYHHLQYLQSRARQARDEKQSQWMRSDYQSKLNEFQTLEELRNKNNFKAKRYANLFSDLVEVYYRMFPKYFQEIYDADLHEVTVGMYDDSPAGFRLVYKHGRDNSSQWTRIHNHVEFIDALAGFFAAVETEVRGSPEVQGFEDDIAEITTGIVNHVRTKEFIESAFYRMAAVHKGRAIKNPLENLDKVEKKPWVYTSGGAMTTLVSCYFKNDAKPTEVARWVESPMELLTFLVDTLKKMPEKTLDEYIESPHKSLLIHSPTHAFLLKPGYSPFNESIKKKQNTYTWLRDRFVAPMKEFTSQMFLDYEKMQYLFQKLEKKVPKSHRHYFKQFFSSIRGSMLVRDFRQHLIHSMEMERGLQFGRRTVLDREEIDGTLYKYLPLFPAYQLEERGVQVLDQLTGFSQEQRKAFKTCFKQMADSVISQKTLSSKDLKEYILATICLVSERTSCEIDCHLTITRAMQELGFALPAPVIFADSNWVKDEFGFVVNPGTGDLEYWRLDYTGSEGYPMRVWDQWLNGSRKDIPWGIYTKPHEYKMQVTGNHMFIR